MCNVYVPMCLWGNQLKETSILTNWLKEMKKPQMISSMRWEHLWIEGAFDNNILCIH